jgi:hypothetical protein
LRRGSSGNKTWLTSKNATHHDADGQIGVRASGETSIDRIPSHKLSTVAGKVFETLMNELYPNKKAKRCDDVCSTVYEAVRKHNRKENAQQRGTDDEMEEE